MTKQRILNDPQFGELRHEVASLWTATLTVTQFGQSWEIALNVSVDEENGIEPEQRDAFQFFIEHRAEVLATAESAIRMYAATNGTVGSEVSAHVTPVAVTFPYAQSAPTFGILYDTSWDQSHGAAVKFINGQVVDVGIQDIVL